MATAARLLLGSLCVARPARVLHAIGGPDSDDHTTQVVAQVLGTRLVLQGLGDLALGPRLRPVDITIELTHTLSMLAAAHHWPLHRRSALVSGTLAACIGALDIGWRPHGPTGMEYLGSTAVAQGGGSACA